MEPGFVKADSRNLPEVNHLMIAEFFSKSDLYLSAEIRAVKNQRWVTVGETIHYIHCCDNNKLLMCVSVELRFFDYIYNYFIFCQLLA